MEQLNSVLAAGLGELQQTVSLHELEQLKSRYIGKQGQNKVLTLPACCGD